MAKLHKEFEEVGVQVLVLSTDSKFSHKAWHESELCDAFGTEYPYPMLSDSAGKIGEAYGIYNSDAAQDIRGTVLINKEGVVQLLNVNVPPIGRSPEELLRCARALKEHDSTGKVIPANWQPGGETITPAIENSGKMWQNYKGIMQDKK